MKKKIFHNIGLKIASVVVAFVIWFLVAAFEDPLTTVTFSNVKVNLKNTELLEQENKVYEVLDKTDTVRVTVQVPISARSQMRASDIIAEADVSKLTDINTIAISYSIPNFDEKSVIGDHDVVKLSVEERMTKWITVQYEIEGEIPESYMIGNVAPDQNRIEVSGAKSLVEKIRYAGVAVDVSGATSSLSMNVEPQLYDADGNLLDSSRITQNIEYIHMSVEVLATKEVPIEVRVSGTPAEGYINTGVVECSRDTVKLGGTVASLLGVSKIVIPEERMNLNGRNSNLSVTLNIRDYISNNLRFADPEFDGKIEVTAYIEQKAERRVRLTAGNFDIANVPEGFKAEIVIHEEAPGYDMILSGLHEDVSAVQQNALRGIVDVAAWMRENGIEKLSEGSYEMPAAFEIPGKVEVKDDISVTVAVTVPE